MPVNVDKDVLRLDVSIDHVFLMQVLNSQYDLREVESSLVLCEFLQTIQMKEDLSSCA